MFRDFEALLSAFNDHGVRYLIVGGYAVSFHAQPRATKDLDIFIKADPENAGKAYQALASFGAPLDSIASLDLADPNKFLRFGHPPVSIDILSHLDGVDFEAAWNRRIDVVINRESGLNAFFISKSDLIASKLAAGRLRDLADVEEIREAEGADPETAE